MVWFMAYFLSYWIKQGIYIFVHKSMSKYLHGVYDQEKQMCFFIVKNWASLRRHLYMCRCLRFYVMKLGWPVLRMKEIKEDRTRVWWKFWQYRLLWRRRNLDGPPFKPFNEVLCPPPFKSSAWLLPAHFFLVWLIALWYDDLVGRVVESLLIYWPTIYLICATNQWSTSFSP